MLLSKNFTVTGEHPEIMLELKSDVTCPSTACMQKIKRDNARINLVFKI
jgi:hypothetical protein